jgi:hypothetical protein
MTIPLPVSTNSAVITLAFGWVSSPRWPDISSCHTILLCWLAFGLSDLALLEIGRVAQIELEFDPAYSINVAVIELEVTWSLMFQSPADFKREGHKRVGSTEVDASVKKDCL